MMFVEIMLYIVTAYLIGGVLFFLPFVIKGVTVIDEGAHGASIGFRLIIIPGVIIFWPVLTRKWIKALKQKRNTQAS